MKKISKLKWIESTNRNINKLLEDYPDVVINSFRLEQFLDTDTEPSQLISIAHDFIKDVCIPSEAMPYEIVLVQGDVFVKSRYKGLPITSSSIGTNSHRSFFNSKRDIDRL